MRAVELEEGELEWRCCLAIAGQIKDEREAKITKLSADLFIVRQRFWAAESMLFEKCKRKVPFGDVAFKLSARTNLLCRHASILTGTRDYNP